MMVILMKLVAIVTIMMMFMMMMFKVNLANPVRSSAALGREKLVSVQC